MPILDVPSICDDLSCAECGYNLRTLPLDSNCPECGYLIIDSINARPMGLWLAAFRRGVTVLLFTMAASTPPVQLWLWEIYHLIRFNPDSIFRFTHPLIRQLMALDRLAVFYFIYALVFLPAIWFITRPGSVRQLNLARFRRWLLVLTAAQLALAPSVAWFTQTPTYFVWFLAGGVRLIGSALMPLIYLAILWLLLELLYNSLSLLRRPIPRIVFRSIQWPLICSHLVPAISWAVACVSILFDVRLLSKPQAQFLDRYIIVPAFYLQYPFYFAMLLLVLHCRFRLHRAAGLLLPAAKTHTCLA